MTCENDAVVQRLDTALSRALLDGKAGVTVDAAALEQALQQQLLHGGTLDTLLLETGLLDESAVQRALAAAWQTDIVDVKAFEDPEPAATKLLPERMALALGTAPFAVDDDGNGGRTLHVGVRSPLDKGLVDEVAALIKVKVVAHVVPEVRVWQGLHKAYGTPLEDRFLALLRMLSPETRASSTLPVAAPPSDANDPVVSWDLVEAMAHLAAQDSRDGIARVATSFARRFLPFAALFGVRQNACIGWHRAGPAEGAMFASRPFTITPDCLLHPLVGTAATTPSPYLGKPPHSEGNSALFGWLGRRRPKSILLVPIVVARRPVAALYADGGIRARDPRELGDLVAFTARLGPAFEALLRTRQTAVQDSSRRQSTSLFPQAASELPEVVALNGAPPIPMDDGVMAPPPLLPTELPSTSSSTLNSAPSMPPPLPPLPAVPPLPSSMPPVPPLPEPHDDGRRDGTSPFAKKYVPPPRALPTKDSEKTLDADDDVNSTPIVLSGIGAPLLDERLAARLHRQDDARSSTLFAIDDAAAPAVWQGALLQTVEQGLQGGVTPESRSFGKRAVLDDDGWEDVIYDASHANDLDGPPARSGGGERIDLSFPELSTSTLAGLYGEEDDGDDDDDGVNDDDDKDGAGGLADEATARINAPLDPPLSTLSHKDLVELLFAGDDDLVARASRELVSRGLACVPALSERFPGRLRVDPFDPGENVRSADRTGPVVDVLARLGPDGLDAAIPHVDSRYPAHRFAAVLLFSLTPDPRAIDLLRARLHDQEPRIRDLAAEALMPFLAHPRFEALLVHLRERTSTTMKPYPVESRRRAIELLGQFRDVGAVPLLIALLGSVSEGALAEDVRTALRAIALADFGNRPKPWEKWWSKAKKRSRLDWLIDALSSEELELRQGAHRELASLAGDDFGYRPDADKRARTRAIEVWQQWWTDEKARAPRPAAVARSQ